MKRTYSQIDVDERRKIARWRTAGVKVDIIAEKLGRHRSTIFRELGRNTFADVQMPELNGYYCLTANDKALERRAKLRKLARFASAPIRDRAHYAWLVAATDSRSAATGAASDLCEPRDDL